MREDLARFIKELGYDTIRNEVGSIPYVRSEKLEYSCYREIDNCDILVCIIGGRFGTSSSISNGSITQNELRTAYSKGKQVYIFVDKNVLSERTFYHKNRSIKDLNFNHVTDVKVFDFIDEVDQLPTGNPLFGFEHASDIANILKEQMAGLFQRLLKEHSFKEQIQLLDELKSSIATVGELVKFLSIKSNEKDLPVQEILLTDHPIFTELKKITKTKYRIFFSNLGELSAWLSSAKSYSAVKEEAWDSSDYKEWIKLTENENFAESGYLIKIWTGLFDENGALRPIDKDEWKEEYVTISNYQSNPFDVVSFTAPSLDKE